VFGHEILAEVVAPPEGSSVREGDRVVVDPWLSCAVRGASDCARCAVGEYATCERAGTGPFKGIMLGACRELPGGFSERMLAHRTQLFRVPDSLSDARAVLAEPLSVAVHAVMRHAPRAGDNVLVIGGGIIAFSTLWALRELCPDAHVTVLALEAHQLAMASELGAQRVLRPKRGVDVMELFAAETSATLLRPILGRPFLAGGYDRVFDCIGSPRSLDDAMRATRSGGTVVLIGNAGEVPKLDWSFVWSKEITFAGTLAYGFEREHDARRRTFEITLERLASTRAPIEKLVTHTFKLEEYGEAIRTNVDRSGTKSVKTVFAPRA
jgi:threonine dehydrogenase-like Zn-dependent dehydrogenase